MTSKKITLRDYFAGQALVALIAKTGKDIEAADVITIINPIAEDAYLIADQMIKEGEK